MMPSATSPVNCHPSSLRDYFTLLKPGVLSLVVFTGAVGLFLAPGTLHPLQSFLAVLCIAMASGAGGAMNMWYDRDIDAVMKRTANRPVPAGRISPEDALAFGLTLALFSVLILGMATNWWAAGLLAFAIYFYTVIYTVQLKRFTPQNIVIGGAAGAFPPVIGWLAVVPEFALLPWILFAIIFLWTPPHFWALALYRSGDYEKAGVPMLPVVAGVESTKNHIIVYSYVMVLASLLPWWLAGFGLIYGAGALLMGGYFIVLAHRVKRSDETADAMKLFGFSIAYLFLLFALLVVDAIVI